SCVCDQIDAESPFCLCLRLSDEIAQDSGRIDVGADRTEPAGFADRSRESGTRDARHARSYYRRGEPEGPGDGCRKHDLDPLIAWRVTGAARAGRALLVRTAPRPGTARASL